MMKKADHQKGECEEKVTAMKPVRLCSASDRIEADMMIDILNQNGIQAYRQSVGAGGIMDIYAGNSTFGEDVFVDERDLDRAGELVSNMIGEP